jgi:hypothetical protein
MRIKRNSKNQVFLNWNNEHIASYLIHLYIKKKKLNEKKKQHKIGANQMEFQMCMSYNL